MSKKEVVICDMCGQEIHDVEYRYKLTTPVFYNALAEKQWNTEQFDFCDTCASQFPKLLKEFVETKNNIYKTCTWASNESTWETECGYEIADFQEGMKFCPFCGRYIREVF